MLVIHVWLSRAASFLDPQHREGADTRHLTFGKRDSHCRPELELCLPRAINSATRTPTFDFLCIASAAPSRSRKQRYSISAHTPRITQRNASSTATMSDAGSDAAKGLSDDEIVTAAAPVESENGGTPRDTVEENGLDDEDDLFGEGGDAEEEPAV